MGGGAEDITAFLTTGHVVIVLLFLFQGNRSGGLAASAMQRVVPPTDGDYIKKERTLK